LDCRLIQLNIRAFMQNYQSSIYAVVVDQNPPASSDRQHEEPGGFRDGWWAPVPRSTAQWSGARPGWKSLGVPPDPTPDQEGVTCQTPAYTDTYKD
jgi:hypothetical protein